MSPAEIKADIMNLFSTPVVAAELPDADEINQALKQVILTDIPNNPGTQGGPLLTLSGEFVGVQGRLIESRTTNTILNFAVPGYNTAQELAVLEDRALGFDPDVVLLLMCGNDHEASFRVDADGWLHRPAPLTDGEDTRIANPYTPRPSRWGPLRHSAALLYAKWV